MAAPYPPEAQLGAPQFNRVADQIYGHFVWMARWSDEINDDADLDMKKLMQLAFTHCRLYAYHTAVLSDDLLVALETRFRLSGVEWPNRAAMQADLVAMRQQAEQVHALAQTVAAEPQEFAKRTLKSDGTEIETPIKVSKVENAEVVAEVAKLRALFA